jgi:hypothetical protein
MFKPIARQQATILVRTPDPAMNWINIYCTEQQGPIPIQSGAYLLNGKIAPKDLPDFIVKDFKVKFKLSLIRAANKNDGEKS